MSEIFINRTSPLQQLKDVQQSARKGDEAKPGKFQELLAKALTDVDQLQKASGEQIEQVLSGEIKDVHSAMIAMQKAGLSFQMVMQVRNKLVEAYHEIMRMQV